MCKGSQQWSLSLFSSAGGKEREKAQRIFEEFERIGRVNIACMELRESRREREESNTAVG